VEAANAQELIANNATVVNVRGMHLQLMVFMVSNLEFSGLGQAQGLSSKGNY
jgi:hypothetical protein